MTFTLPDGLRWRKDDGPLLDEPAFEYDDGGRAAAGFKGTTGDCVTRAIAIITRKPYREVYDLMNYAASHDVDGGSARTGIYKETFRPLLVEWGFSWTPTMKIGSGCRVHLRGDELPPGRLLVSCSRHLVAVIDGVIHDTHESVSRNGTRCVYGYWTAPDRSTSSEEREPA